MSSFKESAMKGICFLAACVSVMAVFLICWFLFSSGIPAMAEIGFGEFLFGTSWKPSNGLYGIFPMIMGSVCVTGLAALTGVPVAVLTSVFLVFYCPEKLYRVVKGGVDLMAGIPSVVYGFFGLVVLVPLLKSCFGISSGKTMLTAAVLLGVMILPTVAGVIEPALRSVPESYYEGALALGASHSRAVYTVCVPAASSGIVAGLVLGIGRAVGETMAVIMIAGNQPVMPESILKGIRTLTANIVLEMGYAEGLHRNALIATGVVLFVFILIINVSVSLFYRRKRG